MAWTKAERWARANVSKTVHCVRLGHQYTGKIFELLTSLNATLFALEDARDFTAEAWIDGHNESYSIMAWPGHDNSRTLNRGEYFIVLDSISLTEKRLSKAEIDSRERSGQFHFSAIWYWSILFDSRVWMFKSRGRLAAMPRSTPPNVEAPENS